MVRFLLILAVVGGLVSGFFGYQINEAKKGAIADATQTHATLDTTQKNLSKTSEELKSTKTSLDDVTVKLGTASNKIQETQAALTAAQAKSTELEGKLADSQRQITIAQQQAKDAQGALGAQSSAATAAAAKVTTLENQLKIDGDNLAKQKAEVARLKDIIDRTKDGGKMPPVINGKIVSVNTNWNFVVLNIGTNDGVVPNGELTVTRNKQAIGKVKVVSAEANLSTADIEATTPQGQTQIQIQPGDGVIN